jgi:putative MATE family efflux protein
MKYELDMTSGNLFKKIIKYTIPILLTSLLQILYNACDVMVVGKFAGEESLAAVGSTGSLISLVVGLFMGLSIGASVAFARSIGAKDLDRANRVVHTSVIVSSIASVILTIVGILLAKKLLILMDSPDNVIDLAALYVKIYFGGTFFNLLYNFASSVVSANGDTKRTLYILSITGVINVVLNLVFVLVFKMKVEGVAIATVVSQAFSAIAIMRLLIKENGPLNFSFKKLKVDFDALKEIIKIGLPSGIQSSLFSISNVVVQTSVNGFGSTIMAANAAAANLESFVYVGMNSVYQSTMNFTSQNYGAKKIKNIKKVLFYSLSIVAAIGLVMGIGFYLCAPWLLKLYTSEPEVIKYAIIRMSFVCLFYASYGVMDVMVGALRGIGQSLIPMIVSILGICVLRIAWINTIFKTHKTLETLYISYPISWVVTLLVLIICYLLIYPRMKRKLTKIEE